jgi:hypothetical protein
VQGNYHIIPAFLDIKLHTEHLDLALSARAAGRGLGPAARVSATSRYYAEHLRSATCL